MPAAFRSLTIEGFAETTGRQYVVDDCADANECRIRLCVQQVWQQARPEPRIEIVAEIAELVAIVVQSPRRREPWTLRVTRFTYRQRHPAA